MTTNPARSGWHFTHDDTSALECYQRGAIIARVSPQPEGALYAFDVYPPGRPDVACLTGTADTLDLAIRMVQNVLAEHPPMDADATEWVVRCPDARVRHSAFQTKREAEAWAYWGHACLVGHTITERPVKDADATYPEPEPEPEPAAVEGVCRWYALCEGQAVGLVAHPVLGQVPTCQHCADTFALPLFVVG